MSSKINVLIAGARPHKRVTSLKSDRVHISGWHDDIREAYASARIFVAPIWSGTGQQNKILEAMALGLPCITTPPVNNAILGQDGVNILLASDVFTFVDKINFLLSDDTAIYNIGQQAKIFVKQNFSWKQNVLKLVNIILSTIKK
ncbi:MAG: glycosyltransferase family 4 protein [Saprospiraceae bacterium]|nr:glycosyltransferase family 4 protein [Saprospiraceae bacterium]